MQPDSPVNGPLVSTYGHARAMVIFLIITDVALALVALGLLINAIAESNALIIAATAVYLVVAARTMPKRFRQLQLTLSGGVVIVHEDGLILRGDDHIALPWDVISKVTVFKVGGFGRLKLALKLVGEHVDVNMVANIAELERDILSRWTPPSHR